MAKTVDQKLLTQLSRTPISISQDPVGGANKLSRPRPRPLWREKFPALSVHIMALRREVLRKYREVLSLSRSWRATDQAETAAERSYIREEARRLFRKNKHVGGQKLTCLHY